MDLKEKEMIHYYYNLIKKRQFTEKDVYAFLMLLRPYSEKNTALREFSNFVAHRNKDRESIKEYCNRIHKILNNSGNIETKMKIETAYTLEEFKVSLNNTVEIANLSFNIKESEDILFCVMILLQNCYLFSGKNKFAKLSLAVFNNYIFLLANVRIKGIKKIILQFPVLKVKNNYFDKRKARKKSFITADNTKQFCYVVRIKNDNKFTLEFIRSLPVNDDKWLDI